MSLNEEIGLVKKMKYFHFTRFPVSLTTDARRDRGRYGDPLRVEVCLAVYP
jgi:hypothetical protein